MNILVTGCAGFIGSNVCSRLIEEGNTVVGLDDLNDAYDVRLKHWRLDKLKLKKGFVFHLLDIRDKAALERCLESYQSRLSFYAIINLAARAGVRQSVADPWIYYQTNVIGTVNLLELCRKYGINKFVLASSSSVYGDASRMPFKESSNTDTPLSPYAASKKATEALAYSYHFLYKLDVTVFRYFTVFGPAGRPDLSIFKFIKQISEGQEITVFGDGSQTRDFTYVDDIARGTVLAIKPLGYEIINLGNNHPYELNQIITTIETQLGQKAKRLYTPPHPADVPATWADISKAKTLLDWQPRVSVEEGIQNTVKWYKENRDWAKNVEAK
jgi:nucleoside-diphosphate-sugar epimerase